MNTEAILNGTTDWTFPLVTPIRLDPGLEYLVVQREPEDTTADPVVFRKQYGGERVAGKGGT